jgi:deazaflavin-dependent oxidoreductase (nitroreductase family)
MTSQPSTSHPYVPSGFVMTHLVNPIVERLGGTLVLTVPGRRTGRLQAVPLGRPFEVDGVCYLVSGGGETHWVRNLRAAGGGELRLHGKSEPFRAVEIEPGPEHDRIVAAYREAQGRTVAAFFTQIPNPADHAVFRVESECGQS